ncbi:MAG: hypothetical protein HY924_11745 [Elusimicrobia bacterium]|nr:hypothetical protein [Elusimicrobiota bacterium]
MLRSRTLLLACLLAWPALSRADEPGARPYDINSHPLSNREFGLLFKSSYTVKEDGTVWAPAAGGPVLSAEMPYLVEKLVRGQRLKALLTLNLILSRSQGEKHLTDSEREAIRATVRENWYYLNYDTRKDFKSYFNRDELDAMNAEAPLPRAPLTPMTGAILDDHDSEPEAEEEDRPRAAPPEGPTSLAGEPLDPSPRKETPSPDAPEMPVLDLTRPSAAAPPVPAAPPLMTPLALVRQPAPPPAPAAQLAPVPPAQAPAKPSPAPSAAKPAAAAPVPAAPAPAAPLAGGGVGSIAGLPAGMSREEYERLFPTQPPAPAPAPAKPAPAPAPELKAHAKEELAPTALVASVTPEQFQKFLLDAPYSRQVRAVLKLVSDHAPSFARDRSLSLVMTALPNIVIDPARTGRGLRHGIEEAPGRPVSIVLSPGPVLYEKKGLFFSGAEVVLSQSPDAYRDLGLPMPGLEAMNRETSPAKTSASDWGETLRFDDGSSRGSFTPEQQAGTLLAALLSLDLARRGQAAEPFTAELYCRTAQMMLYSRMDRERGSDEFLDRETRASYRQWVQGPSEFRDHLLHTMSAGMDGTVDPSRAGPAASAAAVKTALSFCQGGAAQASSKRDDSRRLQAQALKSAGLIEGRALDEAVAYIERNPSAPGEGGPEACRRLERELSDLQRTPRVAEELRAAELRWRAGGTP